MADMIDVTKRYIALIGGIAACMLLMMGAAGGLVSLQGLPGPTIGLSISPISAAIGVLIALALAFGVSLIVGRVVNTAVAAFVLGTGIAALSMQSGTHADAVFAGANETMIGIETLIWGVMVLLLAMGLMRWTGPLPDQPWNQASDAFDLRKVFSTDALRSSAACLRACSVASSRRGSSRYCFLRFRSSWAVSVRSKRRWWGVTASRHSSPEPARISACRCRWTSPRAR
jgi:hypothetical protein